MRVCVRACVWVVEKTNKVVLITKYSNTKDGNGIYSKCEIRSHTVQ